MTTPTSLLHPPLRLAKIEASLNRSAYPVLRNYRFLSRLELVTIISLLPEPPNPDLVEFAKALGINLVYIQVQRNAAINQALQALLIQAVNLCINSNNHPILIHCLDGRRITGLFVLLLRRLQGYSPLSAVSEFWRYQMYSKSSIQQIEIERTSKDLEKFALELVDVMVPERIPRWLWSGNRNSTIPGVKLKYAQVTNSIDSVSAHQSNHPVGSSDSQGQPSGSGSDSPIRNNDHSFERLHLGLQDKQDELGMSRHMDALSLHGLDMKKKVKNVTGFIVKKQVS